MTQRRILSVTKSGSCLVVDTKYENLKAENERLRTDLHLALEAVEVLRERAGLNMGKIERLREGEQLLKRAYLFLMGPWFHHDQKDLLEKMKRHFAAEQPAGNPQATNTPPDGNQGATNEEIADKAETRTR